jgi:hypothetical protein
MKKLLFILLITIPFIGFGQGWEKTFGGLDNDRGYSVQQTTDGGYIITGDTYSFGNGDNDLYIIKTDGNGDTLWTKTYGGTDNDRGYSVKQTTDGGYIICGNTESFGSEDIYLVKTDSLGDSLWTQTFGVPEGWSFSVQQTSDGGYVLCGQIEDLGNGDYDVYIVKTDGNGNTLWTKTYGGTDNDRGYSVKQTTDGGYIICGNTESFSLGNSNYDVYLIKTDSLGDYLWSKTFEETFLNYDIGRSVQQTSDGGYVICGTTELFSGNVDGDVYLIKTDSLGDSLWTQTFGGTSIDEGSSVQQTTDGGYIITGSKINGNNGRDVYLIKTNSLGDSLWTRTLGGTGEDWGMSVQQTSDGGYIITGGTNSFGNGLNNVYLIKTDSNGNLTTPTWDCIGGSCVNPVTGLGLYTDSLICISNCVVNQSWNCINNVCINSGNGSGTYTDSLVCVSNCIQTNIIYDTNTNTPKIIKITDVLGREIKGKKRKLLFYIYDNGTVDKKIVIE